MPGDPDECRLHGKKCIEIAERSDSEVVKEQFRHLAETWFKLADELQSTLALMNTLEEDDGGKGKPKP
jgi:hypothetical protein